MDSLGWLWIMDCASLAVRHGGRTHVIRCSAAAGGIADPVPWGVKDSEADRQLLREADALLRARPLLALRPKDYRRPMHDPNTLDPARCTLLSPGALDAIAEMARRDCAAIDPAKVAERNAALTWLLLAWQKRDHAERAT